MLERATRGLVFAIQHDDLAAIAPAIPTAEHRRPYTTWITSCSSLLISARSVSGATPSAFGTLAAQFPERGTVNVGLRLGGVTLEGLRRSPGRPARVVSAPGVSPTTSPTSTPRWRACGRAASP
jgi:hypothetical protein